ncbi:hypothetical protein N2152v2_005633 [Parachlorella kessleri]
MPVLARREPRAQKPAAAGAAGKERNVKGREARKATPASTPPARSAAPTSSGSKPQQEPQQGQRPQRERQGVRLVAAALAAACDGQNSPGRLHGSLVSRSQPTFAEEQVLVQQEEERSQQRRQRQDQHSKAAVQAPHPWQGMHSDHIEQPPALARLGVTGGRADGRSKLARQPASRAEQEALASSEEWPSQGGSVGSQKGYTGPRSTMFSDEVDIDSNSSSMISINSSRVDGDSGDSSSDPWAGLIAQARCGTFSAPAMSAAQAAPRGSSTLPLSGMPLPSHSQGSTACAAASPVSQQTSSSTSPTSYCTSTDAPLAPVVPMTPAALLMEVPAPCTSYTIKLVIDTSSPATSPLVVAAPSEFSLVAASAESGAVAGATWVDIVADPFDAGYQAGVAAAMAHLGMLESGSSTAGWQLPAVGAETGWGAGGGVPQCRGKLQAEEKEGNQQELENMLAMLGCNSG